MIRANPLERTIENRIVTHAKKQWGLVSRKMNGLGFNSWPDRMFLIPGGKPLFMEVKRQGGTPTEGQAELHAMLRRLGYEVCVVDDVAQGLVILEIFIRDAKRK